MILVAGATGRTGSEVVKALIGKGEQGRVIGVGPALLHGWNTTRVLG